MNHWMRIHSSDPFGQATYLYLFLFYTYSHRCAKIGHPHPIIHPDTAHNNSYNKNNMTCDF